MCYRLLNLSIAIVVVLGFLLTGVQVSSQKQQDSSVETLKIRTKLLKPAIAMLKKAKVPFDSRLLLDLQWREKLKPSFDTMPELQETVHVSGPMKGVYLAGSLLLPGNVNLEGDTVIIAREFAPDDENSGVSISGPYLFVVFVLGNTKQYEAMRRRPARDFLRFDIGAPCAFVGLAPSFRKRARCVGMLYMGN